MDCAQEVARISEWMRRSVGQTMRRRGTVVALSGGVDSSVCVALAVRAFGPGKVFGLRMPEYESSEVGTELGRVVANQLGITSELEHIGPSLEAIGCYRHRDAAIRNVFPDYTTGWRSKIAIAGGTDGGFNYFRLIVQSPDGATLEKKLPFKEYLQIVAATSFKQRIRKTLEYFHADRLHYAVVGTPNRLEYDQGFFVKNGDGAADIKPIAHLYKCQVYALARYLQLPESVCCARPSTDTYSLQQGQDEFYFALPYEKMDFALWAYNHGVPVDEVADFLGMNVVRMTSVYADIAAKRRATRHLHARPSLIEPIFGDGTC